MTIVNSTQPQSVTGSSIAPLTERVVRLWSQFAQNTSAPLLIMGVWLVMAVPPALFRGYHYVEGLTVTIAQTALQEGYWLTPHLHNFRWIERPTLVSWVIAILSFPIGHVTPFVARLPVILAVLAGCFLIWRTLRPMVSAGAALMGAAAFLTSPIILRYFWTSIADMPLAVLMFGAFLIWWHSFATGRTPIARWICIGSVLAIAGLLKGPQPLAYFFLGLGVFILISGSWRELPGALLAAAIAVTPAALWYALVFAPGDAHQMLAYARLSSGRVQFPHPLSNAIRFYFEALPAAVMASALLALPKTSVKDTVPKNFILALSCYAFACTAALLIWPADVNPRYILPMVLPVCVLGGIGFDMLVRRWTAGAAASICLTLGLLCYGVLHSTVGELFTYEPVLETKAAGRQITELVRQAPAPIYRTAWNAGLNELPYVPYDVTTIDPTELSSIAKPAWIVVPAASAAELIASSGGRIRSVLVMSRSILLRSQ